MWPLSSRTLVAEPLKRIFFAASLIYKLYYWKRISDKKNNENKVTLGQGRFIYVILNEKE